MTVTVHDIQAEYVKILEDFIIDPNRERRNKGLKWIYDDIPAATLKAEKYPRITVLSFTASSTPHSLNCGTDQQRVNATLEVQIRVKKGCNWEKRTDTQWVDYLAIQTIDALRNSTARTSLINLGVFHYTLEFENTVYQDDVIIRQLINKNIMKR